MKVKKVTPKRCSCGGSLIRINTTATSKIPMEQYRCTQCGFISTFFKYNF